MLLRIKIRSPFLMAKSRTSPGYSFRQDLCPGFPFLNQILPYAANRGEGIPEKERREPTLTAGIFF